MKIINKNSKIALVELPPTLYGEYNGDSSQDIFSNFRMPARSTHVLESLLRRDGWANVKSLNPFYHGNKGKFTKDNESEIFSSDILGISPITRTSRQSMELGKIAKKSNQDIIRLAGGFDATARASEYLASNSFDIVIRGEAEKTLPELMERLTKSGMSDLKEINGISYRASSREIVHNPERALLTAEELGKMPHPFYDSKVRREIITAPIETTRGCPFSCEFCSVTDFYGRTYRTKPINYVLEELKNIQGMGKYTFITDDNFAGNPSRTIKLLEAMMDSDIPHKEFGAQVRIEVAKDSQLLETFKRANLRKLFIGIESINDDTLKAFNKHATAKQNMNAVETLRKEGFWVHGMLVAGLDYDTPEYFRELADWANKNLDSMQLFAATPVPGTKFWKEMESQDRILTKDFSLYDGFNVVCRPNPEKFTPHSLQESIREVYLDFYSPKNMLKRVAKSKFKLFSAGLNAYIQFVAKPNALYSNQALDHLKFLKSVS